MDQSRAFRRALVALVFGLGGTAFAQSERICNHPSSCSPTLQTKLCKERPPKQCKPCKEDSTHSLPVGLYNGELRFTVVDLEVPSRGFPFRWARTYSSRASFDFGLGA